MHSLFRHPNKTFDVEPETDNLLIGVDMRIKKAALSKIYRGENASSCAEPKDDSCYVAMGEDKKLEDFDTLDDGYISAKFPIGEKGHEMQITIKKIV